jgi:tRNA A22 N-methylase
MDQIEDDPDALARSNVRVGSLLSSSTKQQFVEELKQNLQRRSCATVKRSDQGARKRTLGSQAMRRVKSGGRPCIP